jgi:hypothetical protein
VCNSLYFDEKIENPAEAGVKINSSNEKEEIFSEF